MMLLPLWTRHVGVFINQSEQRFTRNYSSQRPSVSDIMQYSTSGMDPLARCEFVSKNYTKENELVEDYMMSRCCLGY